MSEYPLREPMFRDHRWYSGKREYREPINYTHISRFLERNSWRPWSKVWSEICNDNKGELGYLVREYVLRLVETNCYMKDGEILSSLGSKIISRYCSQFYVHPENGLLCYAGSRKNFHWGREKPKKKIFEMDGMLYHKHEGIWYRVKTEPVKDKYWKSNNNSFPYIGNYIYPRFNDVFGTSHSNLINKYGTLICCIWKQQAGKKECRRLRQYV